MNVLYFIEDYQASISSLKSDLPVFWLQHPHANHPPFHSVSVEEISLLLRQLLHCPVVLRPSHLLRHLSLESIPFFLVLHKNFK